MNLPNGDRAEPRRGRVSLTGRAWSFIAIGLSALIAGTALGVTDLERAGMLLLVLPAPAWFVVRRARAGLTVTHLLSPAHAEVGEPVEVKLVLTNPNPLGTGPLRVTEAIPRGAPLRFSVSGVRSKHRRVVSYPLPALPRGRHRLGPTTVIAADPFGLATGQRTSADGTEVIVRPAVQQLAPTAQLLAWRDTADSFSHSTGSGAALDGSVREYRHGDDLRRIHWPSTARSGSFMVRQEERPWQGQTLLLLDTRASVFALAGNEQSEAFEWAVAAAASIGVHVAGHLAGRSRRVTLVTGAGQVSQDDPAAMLDLLADSQATSRSALEPLVTAMADIGRDATVFAVLAGQDTAGLAGLAIGRRGAATSVAFVIDAARWRAVTDGQEPSGAAELRAAGWRVVVVRSDSELPACWQSAFAVQTGTR